MKYYKSYESYYGYLKKIKTWERKFTMKAIEKYDYFKEKNPKKIILVKEGSFYITIENDSSTIEINGNDTIYDSYLNISLINYDKYKKKNKHHKMLDELIDQNLSFADTLEEYFNLLQKEDDKSEEN